MNTEIERKFLVREDLIDLDSKPARIKQGFLSDDPKRSVRIRIKDNKAFITIKGEPDKTGRSRFEFEKEINKKYGEQLLNLCKGYFTEKLRYNIKVGNHTFEIDVFKGENKGLVIAEVEMNDIHENIIIPDWLGNEVTGDHRYYNIYLSKYPYKSWKD